MRVGYYLYKKISFNEGDCVNTYHAEMFHGSADRVGAEYPKMHYRYGDNLRHPLCLIKNVYGLSEIFLPDLNLIVSHKIKSDFSSLKHVDFLKVKYSKLFRLPYLKDKLNYQVCADKMARNQTHHHDLECSIGEYFEVIVPMYDAIKNDFDEKKRFVISGYDISTVEIYVSERMFKEYPLFWESGIFMSEEAFKMAEFALDRDYFGCVEINI